MVVRAIHSAGLTALALILTLEGCDKFNTRTVSVPISVSGVTLTYSLTWGWGMSQKICLSQGRCWPWSTSSPSSEVWKRPYNAIAPVYATLDGSIYYIGHNWGVWRVRFANGSIESLCDFKQAVESDLSQDGNTAASARSQIGITSSHQYKDLQYVGLFSLIPRDRGELRGRGDSVAFFTPHQVPEGIGGLSGSCG
jgi:hypothetical protein